MNYTSTRSPKVTAQNGFLPMTATTGNTGTSFSGGQRATAPPKASREGVVGGCSPDCLPLSTTSRYRRFFQHQRYCPVGAYYIINVWHHRLPINSGTFPPDKPI